MRSRIRATVLSVIVLCGLFSAPAGAAPPTYTNPVTTGVVDTFPDPTTVRGKDGLYYAYGTQNPVFQSHGEDGERMLPILRSPDLVHWTYAGEVFTPATKPAWHQGSRLWAPDIRYVDGRYLLYYSVPGRNTVGVAAAPSPTGPWTDLGPVLPSPSGCPTGNIDQALYTDSDGTHYLYWGSYDTICVARMNSAATHIEGEVTQIARGRRMEGAFVVRRDGFYYLFYSDAGCCDGAFSGYQVKAGRSTSPFGPFTDDEGVDLMALTSKGAIVAGATGNRWIGPGHNGLQTDQAGQDWLVYHGIPAENPDLAPAAGGTLKLTRRPMLIDRLDWIGGWPVLRAGAGPSDGPEAPPVTTPVAGSSFDGSFGGMPAADGWSVSGGHVSGTGTLLSERKAPASVRAEADLRVDSPTGSAGLVAAYANDGNHVAARLDRSRGALVTDVRLGGISHGEQVTPLPAGFRFDTWKHVTIDLRGTTMSIGVEGNEVQRRSVPRAAARPGAVGVTGNGVSADNVGAAPSHSPVSTPMPEPGVGELLPAYSDEFSGTALDPAWRWVRGPAAGAGLGGGALRWPTQNAELHLDNNTASVLLRDAPRGDYTIETKLRFTPGQPAQQAGILLYDNDNRYFKMVHSVLPLNHGGGAVLRTSEFTKEGPRPTTTPPTPVAGAPMFGGPAADTLWLRLSHHRDGGAHEVRAATSRDGAHWVHNGVWTLPAAGELKIGLVSMNRTGALAEFDYLRTYRTT
ncbi:family 43 glycosylhydrolase [Amycolatopsis lurida]